MKTVFHTKYGTRVIGCERKVEAAEVVSEETEEAEKPKRTYRTRKMPETQPFSASDEPISYPMSQDEE